jgi:RNA polymerase sigma-70 factor, ECF subfamily
MDLPDEELIAKAKAGDKQAFTELIYRYNGKMLSYLYRYIGDYQKAEDLTVETFLGAYQSLHTYKEMGKFSSWLYRIATNCAKKEARKKPPVFEVSLDSPIDDGGETHLEDAIVDERSDAKNGIKQNDLKELLNKAILKLDKKYREAILLCDVQGLSQEEAAGILDSNTVTIGSRIRRARKMLYGILKKYAGEF